MCLYGPVSESFVAGIVVQGRRCVVLGGGAEAADKARRLLSAGARVDLYVPELDARVGALVGEEWSGLALHARAADDAGDLDGAFVVVLAERDEARAGALHARASAPGGFLFCAIDDPAHCTLVNVAIVRRGPLQIGVASGGRVPALAAALRRALDAQLGEDLARFAERLASLRERTPGADRRAVMERVLTGFSLVVHYALPLFPEDE